MAKTKVKFGLLIFALCVAELVCSLELNMINVALSKLYGIYGDPARVGWLLTAFMLSAASCTVVAASLGDVYGRRRVLVGLLIVACTGSLISFASHDFELIIVGRMLQGASMGILPLCYGLLREFASTDETAKGIGLLTGVYVGGVALGLLAGGLVIDHGAWQNIFLVSAGTALLAITLILLVVPPSAPVSKSRRIDYWGALLLIPGIALPFLGIDRFGKVGWAALEPWALLVVGIGLLVAWVRHEKRHPDPLVDLSQFRRLPIVAANLAMMTVYAGPTLFAIVLLPMLTQPEWTVVGFGLTATAAAMLKIPSNLICAFAGAFNGYLTGRYGAARVAAIAALLIMLTWIVLSFEHRSIWLIGFVMIFGFACPLVVVFAALTTIIISESPPEKATQVAGVLQVVKSLGSAIGAQAIALLLSTSAMTRNGHSFPSEHAYLLVFGYAGALSLIASILALIAGRSTAGAVKTAVRPIA
jgi:MFS family permease